MGETTAEKPSVAFGLRVKHARLGLPGKPNQTVFAGRCGWDQAKQSRIENGAMISMDDLSILARQLDEDPYYIFTGKRPQPVSNLAAQISRMELDHWAEDTILTVARQEERRVKAQREQVGDDFTQTVDRLVKAGFGREEAIRAAQAMRSTAPQSPEPREGDTEPDEPRAATGN